MEDLRDHQDRLIAQFAGGIPVQLPLSEAQFAKDVEAYEVKLAKWKETKAGDDPSAMVVDGAPPASKGKNRARTLPLPHSCRARHSSPAQLRNRRRSSSSART